MSGNFGEPFQHFSEQNIYLDLGGINVAECLKYAVGEKMDYSKLSAEQLKAVSKVIIRKLTNPGQIDFQFQLRRMKKHDQKIAKNQFFDAVYNDFRSTILIGIGRTKTLLDSYEFILQSREFDTEAWKIGLKENDRQINKIHRKYTSGIDTKESLILQLDVFDRRAEEIWDGIQDSMRQIRNTEGPTISIEPPNQQPSTSRWAGQH